MPYLVIFVNLVSLRYTYILDWTKDGFRAASRVIRYLSSIVWNQPLVANFFAYFKPKESLDFRDILFLICCPAHLEDKIKQEYESKKITLCDASSKGKMIPEYDKAFVDVSGGISPACSEDMDDFYLRLVLHSNVSRGMPEQKVYIGFVITETRFEELDHPPRMLCTCILSW